MRERTALVVGPTGATGKPIVAALERQGGWRIYGMSRSPPVRAEPFIHIAADLSHPTSCVHALRSVEPITHVFYAARAPFREGGVEDVEGNVAMLTTVLDALSLKPSSVMHVHLLEGTKWYGMHLGPYRTPAREDDPRHLPPNFYYNQQDLLTARASEAGWSWSASRPSYICAFDAARARNLITVLGVYAAVCRELDTPLDFPGSEKAFTTLSELTDATCLADAVAFIATQDGCRNQAFNVTNGDSFRWRHVWPLLAEWFSMPCGVPRRIKLATWMADKGAVWDQIVRRHGLQVRPMNELASWDFGDFVFEKEWDLLCDTGRLRRAGFNLNIDTVGMLRSQLEDYRQANLLPK
jgi:nucleoside-diphosphate-sugar epimerase